MSLSTLPPELLTHIINQVDAKDLSNLRLVSKNLQIVSTPTFGERCLHNLAFMFSEYSLQHLVQMTESGLGRYVKKIMFGTHVLKIKTEEELAWEKWEMQEDEEDEMTEGELEELDREMAGMSADEDGDEENGGDRFGHLEEASFRAGHDFHTSIAEGTTGLDNNNAHVRSEDPETVISNNFRFRQDSHEHDTMPRLTTTFQQKAITMTRFLDSGRHIQLMTQAFRNLKNHGVEATLGFFDDAVLVDKGGKELWCLGRKCHGFDQFYSGRLNNKTEPSSSSMSPDFRRLMPDLVFTSLLKATEAAGYTVKNLQLDLVEGKSWPLSEQGGVQIPLERWLFEPCHQKTTPDGISILTPGLEWKFNAVLEESILAHLHISTSNRSLRFSSVDLAANAEELHAKRQKAYFSNLYDYGMYAISLGDHAFVDISLTSCSMDIVDMMDFLRSQHKSLRSLTLAQVDLDFDDNALEQEHTPLAFLGLMRNSLQLKYLMIDEIRSAEHKFRFIGGRGNIWTSKKEIQDGLEADMYREETGKYFVDTEYLKHQPSMVGLAVVDEVGIGAKRPGEDGDEDDDRNLSASEVSRNMILEYQMPP
ncbi:hypothetical protein D6C99_09810 [Aureobasidium pullulans]|nr:hypothetical protein D6C99_09810 [Aureobasidium pullulans]